MTAPTIPVLGATTPARKWVLQVNTATTGAATWASVAGVATFTPVTDDANFVDDSDYSSQGYNSNTKTAAGWSATCTVNRKTQVGVTPLAYDVGQEFLRLRAIGKFGPANEASVRFFEWTADGSSPTTEAYQGQAAVGWAEAGGDNKALSTATITLNGQGKLNVIAHPFPAA